MQVGHALVISANRKTQIQFQQTNIYQVLYLTSKTYFIQQQLKVYEIPLPNQHKDQFVYTNAKKTDKTVRK
ncbi:MAG: hypothetical protein B7Y11_04965 [Sphingobacteriia bacterium 24-36-13]|jgi:hypothetical protein|nr:MAG: hypothetical protein B7Y11_04965 [Sphingobacteriia bacterium 24-36-13]